jgi:dihydrolipoamide dehydrogenase
VKPDFPGAALPQVIDSTQALSLDAIPESVCIIGGGVVGVEFASIFSYAGSAVSIVEMAPEILPPADSRAAALMRGILEKDGVRVMTGARLTAVKETKDGRALSCVTLPDEEKHIESELVLVAVGRRAKTEGLCLEKAGVNTNRGAIPVNENFETNVKGIFAIGDCNAEHMLAHAASAQGEAAAEYIMEGKHSYNAGAIPYCVYTSPEIAGVGLTEDRVREKGIDCAVGLFDLSGNGKAAISGGEPGFVKVIADAELGELLGVHIMGPHATEIIAGPAIAMSMEGLAEDIARTVHAHPTVSEAVREAALSVFGNAIHLPPKR